MNLVPGMITAENVFSYNNTLIIPKGTCLTDEAITRLEMYSIISIRIEDEVIPVEPPSVPDFDDSDDESWPYSKVVQSSEEFKAFKAEFNENISTLKNCLNDVVEKHVPLQVDEMLHGTLDMLSNCKTSGNVFTMLQNMRQYDDLTFAHSLNVALICNVFAGWLDFTPQERELATVCGIFHDIG